jgi:hypothetical protein
VVVRNCRRLLKEGPGQLPVEEVMLTLGSRRRVMGGLIFFRLKTTFARQ